MKEVVKVTNEHDQPLITLSDQQKADLQAKLGRLYSRAISNRAFDLAEFCHRMIFAINGTTYGIKSIEDTNKCIDVLQKQGKFVSCSVTGHMVRELDRLLNGTLTGQISATITIHSIKSPPDYGIIE